jgi:hypothetical protein
MKRTIRVPAFIALTLTAFALYLGGCQSVYYGAMEKLGYQKREILVDRVEDARNAQEGAKNQFRSALEKFSAVVNFKGGDLEERYNQLDSEYQRCDSKAKAVHNRIADVEEVSKALFDEWQAELKQYTNQDLMRASERKLNDTRRRYQQLIQAMKRAEKKIDPVLSAFRDQVLFLKHNLNAQAVASLQKELSTIEVDVTVLIKDMEASIAEADKFIKATMKE